MSGVGTVGVIAPRVGAIPEGVTASQHLVMNQALKTLAESLGARIEIKTGVLAAAVQFSALSKNVKSIMAILTVDNVKKSFLTNAAHTYTINADKHLVDIAGGALAAIYTAIILYEPLDL